MSDAVTWHSQIALDFDAKYTTSAPFRERLAVWSEVIERYVPAGAAVVDAGCGSGILSEVAAKRAGSVFGFDGSPEMIAIAQARKIAGRLANVSFKVAQLEDAAVLHGQTFDVALCSSVFEYVDDYWRSFDWLTAHLKPAGTIIFSMPNGASTYRKLERAAYKMTGWPAYYTHVRNVPHPADVDLELRQRKFEVIETRYYASAPILSRPARTIGRPDLADCLFVKVCRSPA